MITNKMIETELRYYRKLRKKCRDRLRFSPKGSITFRKQHGKQRPYHKVDGKAVYLKSSDKPLIQALINKQEIIRAEKHLTKNISLLQSISGHLSDPADTIPAHFDLKEHRDLDKVLSEIGSLKSGKPGYIGRHTATDGTKLKSLSETLLYELFKSKDTFETYYEKPVIINGKTWYPDFTLVRKSDGKIILWEHLGRMGDDEYYIDSMNKLYLYASNGYWPYDNIVYTYGRLDGDIDLTEVERILKMMKLI